LVIKAVAVREQQLLERLDAHWDRVCPSDSRARMEAIFGFRPWDQLLCPFRHPAALSAGLARRLSPIRFFRFVRSNAC